MNIKKFCIQPQCNSQCASSYNQVCHNNKIMVGLRGLRHLHAARINPVSVPCIVCVYFNTFCWVTCVITWGLLFSLPLQRCPTSFQTFRVCLLIHAGTLSYYTESQILLCCDVFWEQTSKSLFIALIHATTRTLFLVKNITQNAQPADSVCCK